MVLVPGALLYFYTLPGMNTAQERLFAIFVATIIALVAQPVRMAVSVLLATTLLALTGTLTPARVLAGFGNVTVWLIFTAFLFSRATVVTPNLHEAARLANAPVPANRGEMESIARTLRGDRPAAWLIKGGHGEGATSDDVLFDGAAFHWFSAPRVQTRNTHGTGCTLSSAISAYLAKGFPLPEAVGLAKTYLSTALAGADALDVGKGPGPVDHFAAWRNSGLL